LAKLYWMFFFVILAALNYGRYGTLFIIAMTAFQYLYGATSGISYFEANIQDTGLQNFWYFIMVLTLTGMTLAIVVYQREQINTSVQKESKLATRIATHCPNWQLALERRKWSDHME